MSTAKTIIYHHRTRGVGAEGVHIRSIVSALRNMNFNVNIVSFPGTDPDESRSNKTTKKRKSIKSIILEKSASTLPQIVFELLEILYNIVTIIRLRPLIKNNIYFIYERYSLFLFITVWLCRQKQIPIILEVNDSALVERVRPLLLKKIAKRIEKWIFTNATGLVFISTKFKDLVQDEYHSIAPYVITPNGADITFFNPEKYDREKVRSTLSLTNKVVCGYVGAFVYWHGIHWFVDLIKNKIKNYPDLALLLVGDGKMFDQVQQMILDNNLEKQVIMTGRVSHDKVPELISAMDFAILPDSNIYGSPMKMFELMAMGVAVISPDYPPISEVIEDKANGWLFTSGDHEECINYTLEIASDENKVYKDIGKDARQFIIENRQWKHNAEKILGLLN